jgi:hypothetical protein
MKVVLEKACSLGFVAAVFVIIGALFLASSAGVGALLHWMLPAVDLGTAILIGTVTVVFTGYCFAKFREFANGLYDNVEGDDDEIEDVAVSRGFRLAVIHEPRRHRRRGARR